MENPVPDLCLSDQACPEFTEKKLRYSLALRLWVESILAVGLNDRNRNQPIGLEVTLRDLLAKLLKSWTPPESPGRTPKPERAACSGSCNVSSIPRGPGALDDPVRIIVDLPPGSGVGPVVSPNLARYGAKSAPLYRSLLNLSYHWFEPGRTRIPVRGGKHWVQAKDPRRYAKVTDDLLVELFYPTSAQQAWRTLVSRAHKDLTD